MVQAETDSRIIVRSLAARLREWIQSHDEQERRLDLSTRVSNLIATPENQGLIARVFEGRPGAEQEEGISQLENEVDAAVDDALSREDSPLAQIVREHDADSAALFQARAVARWAWVRVELLTILTWLGVSIILGVSPALGATVWWHVSPYGLSLLVAAINASFAWAFFLYLVIGIYSIRIAIQRTRGVGHIHPWDMWPAVIAAYLLIALAFFSLLAYLYSRDSVASTLAISLWSTLVAALALLLYIGYRLLGAIFGNRKWAAQADLEWQQESHGAVLSELEQRGDDVLVQLISDSINDLRDRLGVAGPDPWGLTVPNYEEIIDRPWRNLSEQYERLVSTPALTDLMSYIETLEKASIGIAGERGVGKTSLMYAVRNEMRARSREREYLDVWMSAPTAYTESGFLLSILEKLAARVGAQLTGNLYFPNLPPEVQLENADRRRRNMRWAFAASIVAAIAAGLVSLFITSSNAGEQGLGAWGTLALGASIFAMGPLILLAWRHLRGLIMPEEFYGLQRDTDRKYLHASKSLLQGLWFEQREITSSSFSIAGIGLGFTGGSSEEMTRRPPSLPRVVQMWDDFVQDVATRAFGKVIVFVDEVDKIRDTEEIGRFMRILKTLYNPPRLFFVVSISEDVYQQFAASRATARGQRNEFDSSFDDATWVGPIPYEETAGLLNNRIIGDPLPLPFIQMIWAISRGNPRYILRMARDVLQRHQRKDLSEVALETVREHQLEPLRNRFDSNLRNQLTRSEYGLVHQALDAFAQALEQDPKTARKHLAPLDRVIVRRTAVVEKGQATIEESPLPELWNLKAGLFFVLTVCETFRGPDSSMNHRFQKISQNGYLTELYEAQQHLQNGAPELAWAKLDDFRIKVGRV